MEPYTAHLDALALRVKQVQTLKPQTTAYQAAVAILRALPLETLDLITHEVRWAEAAFLRKAAPTDLSVHKAITMAVRMVSPSRGIMLLVLAPPVRI
jgi:hypothetical protein